MADQAHTPEDAARQLRWKGPTQPGDWTAVTRHFRDGRTETWWAADLTFSGYGPDRSVRLVVATADPATLPAISTRYLTTNLPRTRFGIERSARYWAFFEELRSVLGYADDLGVLQQYRVEKVRDPHLLEISLLLVDYPFGDRLYPRAREVIACLRNWGPTVIVSDGDVVFQPRTVAGHVLIYIHKEQMLDDVEQRYPARHYVMVDDKLRILAAMKDRWNDRLTTVFCRQGHYANDPQNTATYPSADMSAESMGWDLNALCEGQDLIQPPGLPS